MGHPRMLPVVLLTYPTGTPQNIF
jgi:hypothetical protein